MPQIKVNDINIYYEKHGSGFPLLMNIGYNIDWWDPNLIDVLSKHFTVVIYDCRGVGRTDDTDLDYTNKTLADDAIGLLEALNIERAHFYGISGFGGIVMEIALTYPERVEKIVLCSTQCMGRKAFFPSPDVIKMTGRTNLAFNSEEQIREIIPYVLTEEYIKNNPVEIDNFIKKILKNPISEETLKRRMKAGLTLLSCKRLKNIKAKTLIMHGKKDILVVPENAEVLANLIPDAKVVLFEKSAHNIFAEESELFTKTLLEFLL
ncbi:MAG: alpha/beta fold hydrolase [Promethearchaeota archaeon]